MSLLSVYILSLFYTPSVTACYEDEYGAFRIEVSLKDRYCGYIYIQKEKVKTYISLGFKIYKGINKTEDVIVTYKNQKISFGDINNKNKLTLKCTKEQYQQIKKHIFPS